MIIKNRISLATTSARADVLSIVEAGIERVLPRTVMSSSLSMEGVGVLRVNGEPLDISRGRVFVIGGGKASAAMAESLEGILGDRISEGIVVTKDGDERYATKRIAVLRSGHPVPDLRGIDAVKRMMELKSANSIGADDVVICLISGGGSALMPCPADGVALEDKQRVTSILLASGANIVEINCVRKHLSCTKGGWLGQHFVPASVVSLIISDVIGNDLSVIASGPTFPDPSTFADALAVLEKYKLTSQRFGSVIGRFRAGSAGEIPETPKRLSNCRNFIIGDLNYALDAMVRRARELGLNPYVLSNSQTGESTSVARARAREILRGKYSGYDALVFGGETTPVLPREHGNGGRNQQFAAATLLAMAGYKGNWTFASAGSDGSDFVADAAGAIVDNSSMRSLHVETEELARFVERYDSYGLFNKTDDALIRTGNTGTNVGDIAVYLLH
jgi:glycerate 2-kinase